MLQVQAIGAHGEYVGDTVDAPDHTTAAMVASGMFRRNSETYIVSVWDDADMLYHYESQKQADDNVFAFLTH